MTTLDEIMAQARTITPDTEADAEEVFRHAREGARLPTGYVVRAVIRCNQYESFRSVACDWSETIEMRHENVQRQSRRELRHHLVSAHPYLTEYERTRLVTAIHFNLRDFGR